MSVAAVVLAALGVVGVGGYQDIGGSQDGQQDVVTAYQDRIGPDGNNEW